MANPQTIAMGPDAKCLVNNVHFAIVESDITADVDMQKTTDSESLIGPVTTITAGSGGIYELVKGGIRRLSGSITAQRDSTLTPGAPPYFLIEGTLIDLKLFPNAVPPGYHCPLFLIRSWQSTTRVDGSPIQTIRFTGQSSGIYYSDWNYA
jgi:hypothetical protein